MEFVFWRQPGDKTFKCLLRHFSHAEFGGIVKLLTSAGFTMKDEGHKITFTKED